MISIECLSFKSKISSQKLLATTLILGFDLINNLIFLKAISPPPITKTGLFLISKNIGKLSIAKCYSIKHVIYIGLAYKKSYNSKL